jgi:outer membrane protein
VGAGINYTWVIASQDADLANFNVRSAWGTVLEAGVDIPIAKHMAINLEVKKIYVKVNASGILPALGGPATSASVRIDPLLLFAGIRYRF